MNENRDVTGDQYIRNLVAASYPKVEEIPDVPQGFRRKWVLRLNAITPSDDTLKADARSLERNAQREITTVLGLQNDVELRLPVVLAVRVDDHHLILEIDCPSKSAGMGDAAAIGTWGILRGADERWCIEDIQGIPKQYWWAMN